VHQGREQDPVQPRDHAGPDAGEGVQPPVQALVDELDDRQRRHHGAHHHERAPDGGVEGLRTEPVRVVAGGIPTAHADCVTTSPPPLNITRAVQDRRDHDFTVAKSRRS
jgi:hypothetical protein